MFLTFLSLLFECGVARNQLVQQNKTAISTANENKFFDPREEQELCVPEGEFRIPQNGGRNGVHNDRRPGGRR